MDHLMFAIARGSTPTLELELPFAAPLNSIVYATISQDDHPVLEYGINADASAGISGSGSFAFDDADSSVLLIRMTQTDTLALTAGDVELQVRIRTYDGADTFLPLYGHVVEAIKEGVI